MNADQAKEYIDQNPEAYFNKARTSGYICPLCGNGTSETGDGLAEDKPHRYKCFKCGFYGDIVDYIGAEYGLAEPKDAFTKAYEIYGLEIKRQNAPAAERVQKPVESEQKAQKIANSEREAIEEYIISCHSRINQTDYFTKRGLSDATIEKYKLGYDPKFTKSTGGKAWDAVIIPTSKHTFTARNTAQGIDKKDRIRKAGGSPLYNTKALYSGKPVFIVEGEIDALSVIDAGAEATALGSTANAGSLIKKLKEKPPANTVILALDNDEDGEETTQRIESQLEALSVPFLKVNIAEGYKDPNEALKNDREAFKRVIDDALQIVEAQKEAEKDALKEEYLKNSTAHHLQSFINGITESVNTPYIPTGFDALDFVLDGGLYEGLYIIGAVSSLGKTTMILQMADQIAQQGQDVLIFSLEMARAELMAKSISRVSFELSKDPRNAKTTRGITTGKRYLEYSDKEKELIQASIKAYGEYAKHLYIHEGIGDIGADQIRETVNKHILITGKAPVVIIDYLQLLAPNNERATDKQNTDKAVMELKRITRDSKTPIVAISSFNRQNYENAVTMTAFKESGAIEYSSDVLLGLQAKGAGEADFNLDDAKKKDPRDIELKILKNRNGATGNKIAYEYYPLFNYFKES